MNNVLLEKQVESLLQAYECNEMGMQKMNK